MLRSWKCACALAVTAALVVPVPLYAQPDNNTIQLERIGRYTTGIFAQGAAEISAFSPRFKRLFVVNAANSSIDAISLADPTNPKFEWAIDLKPYGSQANSVSVRDRLLVAAVQANVKTDPGSVVFFECADGGFVNKVTVGALPDMLTFTPDGKKLLVANEGEPNADYSIDPEGSVSIIEMRANIYQMNQDDMTTGPFVL